MPDDYSSPYKEVGLIGQHVSRPAARKDRQPHGFSGVARRYRHHGNANTHIWGPEPGREHLAKVMRRYNNATNKCLRCGRAKFAVEFQPCRGNK